MVTVHLVGPLRVERAGTELGPAEVGSRKGRTLLRLLCARRGDVLGAGEIVAALWPEAAPADPDAVLASLVSRLRRVLGPDAVVGGREGYRLGAVETDLDRARNLLAEAGHLPAALAAVAAAEAVRLLEAGAVLPEEDAAWAAPVRAEGAALRRRARAVLARTALTDGDPATAEGAARRALDEDPLDEDAARLLMRAQLAAARPADALRVFETLRLALVEELGADPAPETRRLHAAALSGAAPTADPEERPARPAGPALAGRGAELATLEDAWARACGHRSGVVVLVGEPGIGKSRLLAELADLARRTGGTALAGRAYEGERSLFAQPVADALAATVAALPGPRLRRAAAGVGPLGRLVPELAPFADSAPAEVAGSAIEQSQSFAAVAGFLRGLAHEGPVLLAIDDLHRAGRSTLELLHYLGRRLGSEQVLLAAAARTVEGGEALALLGDVATTVPLGPLPLPAVAELAARAGHGGRTAEVMRRTGGLPLFVVEVLRALAHGEEGLPQSLQAAVLDRVGRAGAETERLLRAGAVLGSAFGPLVAADLLGVAGSEALRSLEGALSVGLLLASGRDYEFTHDVVREVLLATTPSPTRLALHARAADLLSADPEATAVHADAAGDRLRATRAWIRAAEQALDRFVASDAVVLASRAVALATELDDAELLGRALVARGRAKDATAAFAAAFDDYAAAREAAQRAGDRRLQMTVLRELGGDVPVALGRPPSDCEPILRECLLLAQSLGDRAREADVLDRLTVLRCGQLDFAGARLLADRSLAAARAADDVHAYACGLDAVKTTAAYLGRVGELAPVLAELEPLLRRRGDLWMLQWTVFESSFVPLAAGDDGAAIDRIDAALQVCRRSGYTPHEPFFLAHRGWVHRLAGRPDQALREGREALDLAARHRHTWWSTTAAALYAGTLLACGARGEAAAVLRPASQVADVPGAEAYLLRCLGPLAEATGDSAVLARADGLLRGIRAPEGSAWLLGADAYASVARAWRDAGSPDRADEILTGFRRAALAAGWPALAG